MDNNAGSPTALQAEEVSIWIVIVYHIRNYMEIYELVIPKDNLLRQIKELVDFNFIYDELLANYCLDNGRNAVPPIRMFKYLLLKSIYDLSDVDVVERSKYDMSFKYFFGHGSRR